MDQIHEGIKEKAVGKPQRFRALNKEPWWSAAWPPDIISSWTLFDNASMITWIHPLYYLSLNLKKRSWITNDGAQNMYALISISQLSNWFLTNWKVFSQILFMEPPNIMCIVLNCVKHALRQADLIEDKYTLLTPLNNRHTGTTE